MATPTADHYQVRDLCLGETLVQQRCLLRYKVTFRMDKPTKFNKINRISICLLEPSKMVCQTLVQEDQANLSSIL